MIKFMLREGWRNFRNLGIYGLLTLLSLTATLTLAAMSVRGFQVIKSWREGLMGKFEIEVFLSNDPDTEQLNVLKSELMIIPEIKRAVFISKEEAAQRFTDQFGNELLDLLEFNPLPPSFVITLHENADPLTSWENTAERLRKLPNVEDVVFQGELLATIERFYRQSGPIALSIVGSFLVISIVFTMLTVVGEIKSREEFIRIVAMSGGTRFMARCPFIAMGAYYGFIAGIFAAGLSYVVGWIINAGWGISAIPDYRELAIIPAAGILIAVVGSSWVAGSRIRLF